jgi:hypothetical protein
LHRDEFAQRRDCKIFCGALQNLYQFWSSTDVACRGSDFSDAAPIPVFGSFSRITIGNHDGFYPPEAKQRRKSA